MYNAENIVIYGPENGPDYYRLMLLFALKKIPWTAVSDYPNTLKEISGFSDTLPVMQYGSCFFQGSLITSLALEQIRPEPSLFPNGNRGMPLALSWWSDDFYRSVKETKDTSLFQKNCAIISRQFTDGREYLQGTMPGLADVNSFAPLFSLKQLGFDILPPMKDNPQLLNWYQRMEQIKATEDIIHTPIILIPNFPACDDIADKITFNKGKNILWHNSPAQNK